MAKTKKPSGNKKRDWIIRIAIFGVLGVALILALLDYRAKQQATQTSGAWAAMLDDANANEGGHLQVKKLKEGIVGSPEMTQQENGANDTDLIYTWKGMFREYKVTVNATSGDDYASVNRIGEE